VVNEVEKMTTKRQWQERQSTINALCCEANGQNINTLSVNEISDIVDQLHRYEITLNRLFTNQCNRELTDHERKKIKSTEEKVKAIMDLFNLPVYFNDDPRGGSIRFKLTSGRSNNMGGEDWGIYW
jgi:hypothetical protein